MLNPHDPQYKVLLKRNCSAFIAIIALAAIIAPAMHASAADLKSTFLSPPAASAPWSGMGFRGGDIDGADAVKRFQFLKDAGFSGMILSFSASGFGGPLSKEEWALVNSYGTPPFFDKVAGLLASAKQLGLTVDMSYGSCWPQGGGFAVTPELAAVEMTFSRQEIKGGTVDPQLTIPSQPKRIGSFLRMFRPTPPGQELPPDWVKRLEARQKIVAVLAVQGTAPDTVPMNRAILTFPDKWGTVLRPGQLRSATTINLTSKLRPDGQLEWKAPPGNWQVFVFEQTPSDIILSCGAGEGPQLVGDPFDRRAFDALTGEVFDPGVPKLHSYFGNTLQNYFIDSSEFASDIFWTENFQEQFKRRRGYDVTPYLPFVFQPGWMAHPYQARSSVPMFEDGEISERVLSDYRLTVSELMTENLYGPFADLMKAHGLAGKIQSHGAPVDTLKVYGLATIPETEDLHVGPDPYFLRMARAAADIYGHPLVTSESMIWDVGGPSILPRQIKDHADRLLLAGVNQLRIFAMDRSLPKPDQPPSPLSGLGAWIGPNQSTWPFIKTLLTYLHRSQAILQQGHNVVSLALFRPDPTYVPASASDEPKTEPEPGFVAGLEAAGYDYDQISDDGIGKSKVTNHRLLTPGGATYNALIIPATSSLRTETADALRCFAKAGLPILFVDRPPFRYAGLMNYVKRDTQVRDDVSAALHAGSRVVSDSDVTSSLQRLKVAPNLTFLNEASTPFLEKAIGDQRVFFFGNLEDEEKEVAFRTRTIGNAELWDSWTGGTKRLCARRAGGAEDISFKLAPHETRMVVIDPTKIVDASCDGAGSAFAMAQAERPSPVMEVGTGGWALHVSGQGAGGRPIDMDLQLRALTDWTTMPQLHDLSGEGRYTTTFMVDPAWLRADRQYWLDLGDVRDAAVVQINDRAIPVPVAEPFKVDVTGALKPGQNNLVVDVVNTPNNSYAATTPGYYGFRPAGLMGPVWLKIGPLAEGASAAELPKGKPPHVHANSLRKTYTSHKQR